MNRSFSSTIMTATKMGKINHDETCSGTDRRKFNNAVDFLKKLYLRNTILFSGKYPDGVRMFYYQYSYPMGDEEQLVRVYNIEFYLEGKKNFFIKNMNENFFLHKFSWYPKNENGDFKNQDEKVQKMMEFLSRFVWYLNTIFKWEDNCYSNENNMFDYRFEVEKISDLKWIFTPVSNISVDISEEHSVFESMVDEQRQAEELEQKQLEEQERQVEELVQKWREEEELAQKQREEEERQAEAKKIEIISKMEALMKEYKQLCEPTNDVDRAWTPNNFGDTEPFKKKSWADMMEEEEEEKQKDINWY